MTKARLRNIYATLDEILFYRESGVAKPKFYSRLVKDLKRMVQKINPEEMELELWDTIQDIINNEGMETK